jgi:inner membrane protein
LTVRTLYHKVVCMSKTERRSMGVKMLLLCGLTLLMFIPAALVEGIVDDRTRRAEEVADQISSESGGPQTLLGPTLAIPWKVRPSRSPGAGQIDAYIVSPTTADATLKTVTEDRQRSLFRVPVFRSDVTFESEFDLSRVAAAVPSGGELDWDRAEILVGISDAHGVLADSKLALGDSVVPLFPAAVATDVVLGKSPDPSEKLNLFGASVAGIVAPQAKFHVTSSLKFSGARRLTVLAWGKTTRVAMAGDWKNAGFIGRFLPVQRSAGEHGYSAVWSVPFVARGVKAEGSGSILDGLERTAMGTSFVELADPYQSVTRSLKYLLLVVGLVFLSYFVFEITTGKCVHPAQYLLVGMAQLVFYVLLLSLAERMGFDYGYATAGAATVVLLGANAGWVFNSLQQAIRATACFSVLYSLIYLLLRMEDNALLVGAIGSFAVVAAMMYLTRGIDWYGSAAETAAGGQP